MMIQTKFAVGRLRLLNLLPKGKRVKLADRAVLAFQKILESATDERDVRRAAQALLDCIWLHPDPVGMADMFGLKVVSFVRATPQPDWLDALRAEIARLDPIYAQKTMSERKKALVRFTLCILGENTAGALAMVKAHDIASRIDLTSSQFASEAIRQFRVWFSSDAPQLEDFKVLWSLRIRPEHPAVKQFAGNLRAWMLAHQMSAEEIADIWTIGGQHDGELQSIILREEIDDVLSFGCLGPKGEKLTLIDPSVFAAFTAWSKAGHSATDRLSEPARRIISAIQKPSRAPALSSGHTPRLLFVTRNWNFLRLPADHLEAAGLDIRFLDFSLIEEVFKDPGDVPSFFDQTHSFLEGTDAALIWSTLRDRNPLVADLMDWADVIFCEWFDSATIWMTRYVPEDKKLVVRLHSYEAFSHQIFHANLQRLDGLVFIAPHIKEIFNAVLGPNLVPHCPMAVIANARDLDHFVPVERAPDAIRTLGMTQFASLNKDPMFAVDILEALLERDSRWRLRLVGNGWREGVSDAQTAYQQAFEAHVDTLGDRVLYDGFCRDMPGWYRTIGFILSTSHREGSHESVVEGMLTGAVPVLRKWPMMSHFGGPQTVFPGLPTFETAEAAAEHIARAADAFEAKSIQARSDIAALLAQSDPAAELPAFVRHVLEADSHIEGQ